MDTEKERRQRLYRVSAIVLKRRDLGEADRLLTVLTRTHGKLSLLAKGVRRAASRKAGHIEPFTYVELLIARGQSLDLVTQAETLEAHRRLREDLWRNSWAYYVAELADAFTLDAEPNQLIFDLVLATLGRLNGDRDPALIARYFELHLLALAGFQPQLYRCVACGTLIKPETNYFTLEGGGVLCPAHGVNQVDAVEISLPVLKVLRFLQSREWEQVAQLKLREDMQRDVEMVLMRFVIYHLERQLRSTAFIERMKAEGRGMNAHL